MVDAVLAQTRARQRRVRDLPSRVVVYLLLAGGLFADLGYGQVWARMIAGLGGLAVAVPTAGALAQARRRIGVAPLRALFDLLRGPAAGVSVTGCAGGGWLVTAIDGTITGLPGHPGEPAGLLTAAAATTAAPATRWSGSWPWWPAAPARSSTPSSAPTGSGRPPTPTTCSAPAPRDDRAGRPQLRRPATCSPRSPTPAPTCWSGSRSAATCRSAAGCPTAATCPGSARLEVRVITATITVTTGAGRRSEVYRLITTVLDPGLPRRRDRRALPPAVGDRDRVPGTEVHHPRRAGAARPHPTRRHPGDLRAADHLPGAAHRDQRRRPDPPRRRPRPRQLHHRAATPPATNSPPPPASSPTPPDPSTWSA